MVSPFQPSMPYPGMGQPPGMPMMSGAFAPPDMPMMPPSPPDGDIRQILTMLEGMVGPVTPPKPLYAPGYRPPKKPVLGDLWGRSVAMINRHRSLLERFETDRLWLQMHLVGIFEEDRLAKEQRLVVDEFQSTGIVADWNLACAWLAGLPFEPVKPVLRDDRKIEARQMQDAVRYLRSEEESRYADAWGADLAMEEARYLTIYGRIVNRTVLNLADPDFPFDSTLIDPATVFFNEGGRGIAEAFHRYHTTYGALVGVFGEPPAETMRKIRNDHGAIEWEWTEVEALDYWDTWWRAVVTQEHTFVPVTAHEYGSVPFTRQYGPFGMPVGGDPGHDRTEYGPNGVLRISTSSRADDAANKGLSYIHYMRREHAQYEAIMSRIITGFKKAINPPLLRERALETIGQPVHPLNTGPGQVNTTLLGAEKVSPIPTSASPIDTNILLTATTQEQRGTRLPPMFGGIVEQSNISGTAQNGIADQGMEKLFPWRASVERYHAMRFTRWFGLWRNFGHLAINAGEEPSPLMIPVTRPRNGEQPAFELTRELIDTVGPRVEIRMNKPRLNQLLPIVNAMQGMVANGWATDAMAMEALGNTDYDRIREEWMEDKALKQALDHPKFVEMFTIPMSLMEAAREAGGAPEQQKAFMTALAVWMQNVVQPNQMQLQQQMAPQQQGPQGPQGMPPGLQGGVAGMSLPDATGQAPGSLTGVTGRPPAGEMPPVDQPPPPPPGSVLIPPGQPVPGMQ